MEIYRVLCFWDINLLLLVQHVKLQKKTFAIHNMCISVIDFLPVLVHCAFFKI